MKERKPKHLNNFIMEHIKNNLREYVILLLLFITGILIGVFYLNSTPDDEKNEVIGNIDEFVCTLKSTQEFNYIYMLKSAIRKELCFAGIIWLLGITATLSPIIYFMISFRGFCFGYVVSAIIGTLSNGNGILLSISALLFKNIITIPAIFAIAVSGLHVRKKLFKDTKEKTYHSKKVNTKEAIKTEIIRHSIFSLINAVILITSAFVETYISMNLCKVIVQII